MDSIDYKNKILLFQLCCIYAEWNYVGMNSFYNSLGYQWSETL